MGSNTNYTRKSYEVSTQKCFTTISSRRPQITNVLSENSPENKWATLKLQDQDLVNYQHTIKRYVNKMCKKLNSEKPIKSENKGSNVSLKPEGSTPGLNVLVKDRRCKANANNRMCKYLKCS